MPLLGHRTFSFFPAHAVWASFARKDAHCVYCTGTAWVDRLNDNLLSVLCIWQTYLCRSKLICDWVFLSLWRALCGITSLLVPTCSILSDKHLIMCSIHWLIEFRVFRRIVPWFMCFLRRCCVNIILSPRAAQSTLVGVVMFSKVFISGTIFPLPVGIVRFSTMHIAYTSLESERWARHFELLFVAFLRRRVSTYEAEGCKMLQVELFHKISPLIFGGPPRLKQD